MVGAIDGRPVESRATSWGLFDGGAVPTVPYWWEGAARVGVGGGCEVGGLLGLTLRLAPEARCGARWGRFGVAVSGASGIVFGFGRAGPWWRGGLDLGWDTGLGEFLLGVYLTHGRESHRLDLAAAASRDLVIDLPDDIAYDGESIPAPQVARQESRLVLPLGWSFPGVVHFVAGVSPYLIFRAGDPGLVRCAGCRPFGLDAYSQRWGATVTLGVQF